MLLKEVGLVTKGSLVRVDCSDDVLHNQKGTAIDDGDSDGWCHVQIERDNVVYWKTKRKINDDLQCTGSILRSLNLGVHPFCWHF